MDLTDNLEIRGMAIEVIRIGNLYNIEAPEIVHDILTFIESQKCVWKKISEKSSLWKTECGKLHYREGSYCPSCGKKIEGFVSDEVHLQNRKRRLKRIRDKYGN